MKGDYDGEVNSVNMLICLFKLVSAMSKWDGKRFSFVFMEI